MPHRPNATIIKLSTANSFSIPYATHGMYVRTIPRFGKTRQAVNHSPGPDINSNFGMWTLPTVVRWMDITTKVVVMMMDHHTVVFVRTRRKVGWQCLIIQSRMSRVWMSWNPRGCVLSNGMNFAGMRLLWYDTLWATIIFAVKKTTVFRDIGT